MALSETLFAEDLHPIDIVENIAEHYDWDFDRIADDQIAMAVEGQWRTYSITLAWSAYDETLRLICTFEMTPDTERLPKIYELLNEINDKCWCGNFTYWQDQGLMVHRYGLVLTGGQTAGTDQVNTLISSAVEAAERFYPALQLVAYGEDEPKEALKVAIAGAYGRA